MEPHPHKRLQALAVILAIAAILGVVYYFSIREARVPAATPEQIEEALSALQSSSAGKSEPPLTSSQKKALDALGASQPAQQTSVIPPAEEKSLLESLESNK